MQKLTPLGAAILLAGTLAAPAIAQEVRQEPAAYAQHHPWANDYHYRHGPSGFGPGEVAAGVIAGAVGTAGAIASAPFRDSYAYYGEPAYDDAPTYYVQRSQRPACGIQPGATYMGPDGRWYPC